MEKSKKLITMVIISLMFISVFFISNNVLADFYNEADYKVITLNNANNSYVMFINVTKTSGGDINCSGHCNNNFSDIRFEDAARTMFCDYWIEKYYSGNYAWVWVELPSDVEDTNTFVISYGDTHTAASNGTNTFWYFDDWTANHCEYWHYEDGGVTKYYTENYKNIACGYNTRLRYRMNISEWHNSGNGAIQIRYQACRTTPVGVCDSYTELNIKEASNCGADSLHWQYRVSNHDQGDQSNTCANTTIPYDSTKFYIFEQTLDTTSNNISVTDSDSNVELAHGDWSGTYPNSEDMNYLAIGLSQDSGYSFEWRDNDYLFIDVTRGGNTLSSYIDWMFVSNYTTIEPTVSSVSTQYDDDIQFLSINSGTNGTIVYSSTPTINWTIVTNTLQYHLEIDNNADFSSPEVNITDINQWNYPANCNINSTRVSFILPSELSTYSKYYMRVKTLSR